MNLEKPLLERAKISLRKWTYSLVVMGWLLSPHGAESADIPEGTSFPGGIRLLQNGAVIDRVETSAIFMGRQNGTGQWTSEEHGEFEADVTFGEMREQIEKWIKSVGVQRGDTVTIGLWHTHTTHAMRHNYPTLEHPEKAVSPPSLGFMGIVGDTGRVQDEALKVQVLKPLEKKYGITINHTPGVVNPTCRWRTTQMPVAEWRAKYPNLPEIYIMGTIWVPWAEDVKRYLFDSDFMKERVREIAKQRGVEKEQVLREWIAMLGKAEAKVGIAGIEGYVDLGRGWNEKIQHFTRAMLTTSIPADLGEAIFGGTKLAEYPAIQRQVREADDQGIEFTVQDRYRELLARLAEESTRQPFAVWANGETMRALKELLEEIGVRLAVEPAL